MPTTLLKSALLGGLVVFIWGIFSWMVLPLHKYCFHKFTNEARVASVIVDNAPERGMYILPNTFSYGEGSSTGEMRKAVNMMNKGPFMFASVVPKGFNRSAGGPLVFSYVIQVVGAFIVSWLLLQTRRLDFKQKVTFVTVFGFGVGVLSMLPSWNWLGFPGGYVVLNIIDLIIAWFLAGLVIAKVLKVSKS